MVNRTKHEKVMFFLGAAAAADWDLGEDDLNTLAGAATTMLDCVDMASAMRVARTDRRVAAGLAVIANKNERARTERALEGKLRAVK